MWRPCLFLICYAVSSFFVTYGIVNADAPPAVADIVAELQRLEGRVLNSDGLLIRYQRYRSEDITKSRFGNGFLNVEFYLAHRKGRWLFRKQFLNNDVPDLPDIEVPNEPLSIATQNGFTFNWSQSSNQANVAEFGSGASAFQCLDYFIFTGINAAKSIAESNGGDYTQLKSMPQLADSLGHPFLSEFMEDNKSKYSVKSKMENVDGAPCWVVEYPGMDKLWLDPKLGFSVRRRIFHWGPGEPRKFEIHNGDFREVEAKLWLPFSQTIDKYASISSEGREIWGKVTSRLHYRVSELSIGDVPESAMDLPIPSGLLVVDQPRGIFYRVPAEGIDPFKGPNSAQWHTIVKKDGGMSVRYVLVAVNIIIIAIAISFFLWRRNRKLAKPLIVIAFVLGYTAAPCYAEEPWSISNAVQGKAAFVSGGRFDDYEAGWPLFNRNDIEHETRGDIDVETFLWQPPWRMKTDCGPYSLFILMGIEGRDVNYNLIREALEIDPEVGCSIDALRDAGLRLGFSLETRFVIPSSLTELPPPFIIHGKKETGESTGHFLVVEDYDQRAHLFKVIDPATERRMDLPADSVISQCSGYVILPYRGRLSVFTPDYLLLMLPVSALLYTFTTCGLCILRGFQARELLPLDAK